MAHINPVQIQKFLRGVDYPASRQALIDNAKSMGADEDVCDSLSRLPDEDFQTPAEVSQAFGDAARDQAIAPAFSGGPEFLAHAMEDAVAHVELCELALLKSANDELKIFAQQMIDEHGELGVAIERLAGERGLDLPVRLESGHALALGRLAGLAGKDFDLRFMEHHVREHENDLKVFSHYAREEGDAGIRGLAERGRRMLDAHLRVARDLLKRLGE